MKFSEKCFASGLRVSLLLALLALMPFLAWAQGSSVADLRGQVKILPAAPVLQGIPIKVEDERGGTVAWTQTDSEGRFVFTLHIQAIYFIKIRLEGYREVTERVDLGLGRVADILIVLKPLSEDAVPEKAQKEFEKGNKLLIEDKNPQASLTHLQKAVEIHPSFAKAYLLLGTAYMELGQWKEAQAALENALGKNEKLADAYLALGACYNQQKDFAAAEKVLVRGLELKAESPEGHYELGKSYWALGRWQDAEPHARQAVALGPDFAPVHVLLGNILLRKRDAPAALQEFKEYLRLEPEGPLAAATREMVAKIEKALAAPP